METKVQLSIDDIKQIRQTGTTTVGIVCKDAIILASESKSTMGYLVGSKDAKKVFQIDDNMAITTAGGAGDTLTLVRIMKAEIALYKNLRNATSISVKGTITLLANILQSSRYYPYMAVLILGGRDKSGYHIYSIDPLGGFEHEKDFTATGSGSPVAYGVLEADWQEGLTQDEGLKLVVRAISSARERDIFSGGGIQAAIINKDGLQWASKEKIAESLKK